MADIQYYNHSGRCTSCGADTLWGVAPHAGDCSAANRAKVAEIYRQANWLFAKRETLGLSEFQGGALVGIIRALGWMISGEVEPILAVLSHDQLEKANELLREIGDENKWQ